MDHDKKETVGKIALDLQEKEKDNRDPIAEREALLGDYEKNFHEAFERGKRQFGGDFYIIVMTKLERLLQNVIRNYWVVGEVCPTPCYSQSVYQCIRKEKKINLLWTLPHKEACERYKMAPAFVPLEKADLLRCVMAFYDGTLLKKCKELNNEMHESTESGSFDFSEYEEKENTVVQS